MQRRTLLRTIITTVAGGQVFRAYADGSEIPDGPAFEPWRDWRADEGNKPLALVRAAILAANAYNSQPWRFHVTDSRIDLLADTSRNLGAFDPYLREMHFSLGCALENLMVAAEPHGLRASLTLFPAKLAPPRENPGMDLVARVDLATAKPASNDLYDAIPHRHTNRNAYDPAKPVPPEFQRALASTDERVKTFLFTEEDTRRKIVDAIAASSGQFLTDPDVQRGTQKWIRTSREEMDKFRDGTLIERRPGPPRPASLQDYKNQMLAAPLFGLIAVRDRYDREQTIRAGRVWQHAHLLATVHGIAARPANGSIELIDHERRLNREARSAAQLAAITGDATWQPTFMFYMGYANPAQASARRPVELVTG